MSKTYPHELLFSIPSATLFWTPIPFRLCQPVQAADATKARVCERYCFEIHLWIYLNQIAAFLAGNKIR